MSTETTPVAERTASACANRLRTIASDLRDVAITLGPAHAELLGCVGIINATRHRLAVEAGLDELREAKGIDMRLRERMVGGER